MSWFSDDNLHLSDIGNLNIKGADYCYIISLISKNEAVNLILYADLIGKSGKL